MIKLHRPVCPNTTKLATDYKYPENKAALVAACHDKCMYCESKVTHTYYGDIEHIKPKAKFPHLEFTWNNLGYVCAICNGNKHHKWIVSHPFINPFDEEPVNHLVPLGAFLYQFNGSERGEITISEIDLNRPALLQRRQDRIDQLRTLIDKLERTATQEIKNAVFSELEDFVAEHTEYSMVLKSAFSLLKV